MNLDDPRLTAYALGELSHSDRIAIEQELANSPEARAFIGETRQLAEELKRGFRADLNQSPSEARNVLPVPYARLFWSERRWPSFAIAALLVASFSIAALILWRINAHSGAHPISRRGSDASDPGTVTVEYSSEEERTGVDSVSGSGAESPFVTVSAKPLSTFRMRVGTGAYPVVRKLIDSGIRPPRDTIRIEEMINYFSYDYGDPAPGQTAALSIDAASCPWAPEHKLVRVGVKLRQDAREKIENLIRNSQVEVQFDPACVQSYRLIGYDVPAAGSHEAAETGERRHDVRNVTAFYEISPVAPNRPADAAAAPKELMIARVKWLGATPKTEAEERFSGPVIPFDRATSDFRFAAAVAEFGMILRDSVYKGSAGLSDVIEWAQSASANDLNNERTTFVESARKARTLL